MGYNTAAIFLNDTLHELARDPEAGAKIQSHVLRGRREPNYGPHGVQALPSQHADTVQIVAVGGNTMVWIMDELMREPS